MIILAFAGFTENSTEEEAIPSRLNESMERDDGHDYSYIFAYIYLATVSPTPRLRARQVALPHYWPSPMLVHLNLSLIEDTQFLCIRKVRCVSVKRPHRREGGWGASNGPAL